MIDARIVLVLVIVLAVLAPVVPVAEVEVLGKVGKVGRVIVEATVHTAEAGTLAQLQVPLYEHEGIVCVTVIVCPCSVTKRSKIVLDTWAVIDITKS